MSFWKGGFSAALLNLWTRKTTSIKFLNRFKKKPVPDFLRNDAKICVQMLGFYSVKWKEKLQYSNDEAYVDYSSINQPSSK